MYCTRDSKLLQLYSFRNGADDDTSERKNEMKLKGGSKFVVGVNKTGNVFRQTRVQKLLALQIKFKKPEGGKFRLETEENLIHEKNMDLRSLYTVSLKVKNLLIVFLVVNT
jgi:hypothetical protein